MARVTLTAAQRLADSRLKTAQALKSAANTPPLSAQLQAALTPSIQQHPLRWVLGALAAGGVLTLAWKRLPLAARTLLLQAAQGLGQEAVLAWWLALLRPHQKQDLGETCETG